MIRQRRSSRRPRPRTFDKQPHYMNTCPHCRQAHPDSTGCEPPEKASSFEQTIAKHWHLRDWHRLTPIEMDLVNRLCRAGLMRIGEGRIYATHYEVPPPEPACFPHCDVCGSSAWFCSVCQPPRHVILTCVYCGHAYPDGTPTAKHDLLTAHIKVCEKHPLRAAEERIERLKEALEGLLSASTSDELEALEVALRAIPGSFEPKVVGINAIRALLDELENTKTTA